MKVTQKKPAYCARCERWFATAAGLSAHKRGTAHNGQVAK